MKNEKVIFVDPTIDNRWNTFVEMHPLASIYHHSCWMELLRQTYDYKPYYLACTDEQDHFQAILPLFLVKSWLTGKRLISVPFSPYSGPLFNDEENLNPILRVLENRARCLEVDYVQLRCATNDFHFKRANYYKNEYYRIHKLDLRPNTDILIASFHKSCIQRPILRSLKNGLVMKIAESEEDVKSFYHLQSQTRKKHGVPPQPYAYFLNMWKILYPLGYVQLLLAVYENRTVAAVLLLKFKETVIYQNGASDEQFLSLKPNHFLLWKAIEMAKAEGYHHFDFGTSSPQDKGLIQFKQRWGTKEYYLPYYCYPKGSVKTTNIESRLPFRVATAVFHYLPISVLRRIGEISYRHVA